MPGAGSNSAPTPMRGSSPCRSWQASLAPSRGGTCGMPTPCRIGTRRARRNAASTSRGSARRRPSGSARQPQAPDPITRARQVTEEDGRPARRLATLPAVAYVLGAALSTLPASLFMKRRGRRAGFLLGSSLGIAGGAVGAIAIALHSFALLLAGTFLSGIYNAFGQYYRFAAADAAPPDWKSRAISLTLAGGIFGGFIGPAVGRFTRDLVEPQFLASYAVLAVFALASFVIAAGLSFPEQSAEERHGAGRPLGA